MYKREITSFTPAQFPILVITKDKDGNYAGSMINNEQLGKFAEQYPDYTLQVPPGSAEFLSKHLTKSPGVNNAWFKVEQQLDGKQLIKATEIDFEGHENIGWYEADNKTFTAKYYLNDFGADLKSLLILPSLVISLVAYGFVYYLGRTIWRKRQKILTSS